ncbi:alpha-2-macroglobulin family protein [Treponema vincentii ATCC 35580]|uniref:Alpha-2-macroglobulin family protein n=1 Tax=Treponema vincentii ATCC 35580 TaxID=596324 RepID=C8PRI8_9SPIR|nr:MG2 domain-containing protein [Treponema vincentii]EEV19955.1 alpha-2-macroglobulin family protein [Treponema vincentii ATCC 35580]
MKKAGIVLMIIALTAVIGGCGKGAGSTDAKQKAYIAKLQEQTQSKYDDPNISDFEKQFLPQYAIETPEPEQEAKIPAFKAPAPQTSAKDASVIPGVRALTAYQTAYTPRLMETGAQPKDAGGDGNSESADSPSDARQGAETIDLPQGGALTVADWGPKGKIPAAVTAPSLYVVFSLPVKAIAALEKPAAESSCLSISPAVKGIFRWYGSRYLAFEPEESLKPGQEYTMTVKDGVQTLNGKKIEGRKQFKITSETLRITYMQPGYTLRKNSDRWIPIDTDNLIPEAANDVQLSFNYPVRPEDLSSILSVSVQEAGKQAVPYRYTISRIEGENDFNVLVTIDGKIPFNATVTVAAKRPDGSLTSVQYHTLKPFTARGAAVYHNDYGYTNPIRIGFSHPVDTKTVLNNISINPPLAFDGKNIEVLNSAYNPAVLIHSLPVSPQEKYTVTVQNGIKDIYGRAIASAASYTVTIPDAPSFVQYNDSGHLMLEAAYPHKYLFEYQNILSPSDYAVAKTDDPLNLLVWGEAYDSSKAKTLDASVRNKRQFELADLDPYLENGKGFVRIDTAVTLPPYSQRDKKPHVSRRTSTVQVTDLGITVRAALNKTVVMVSKLSTGEPVEGASVYLYDAKTDKADTAVSPEEGAQNPFASGTTDKEGLAVLPYGSKSIRFFRNAESYTAVFVEKDGDRAVFYPHTHSPWRFDVSAAYYPQEVAETRQRTFLFSDRGLYKPGETVSFRGIDRTQTFSTFTPYEEDYTVTLSGYSWEGDDVEVAMQGGTCTGSGSFWGSFDLPDDLAPGSYSLTYRRADDTNSEPQECLITVAYFEKLKFQAEVALPQQPLIMGDMITAAVSASYLSGGGLGRASYSGSWMRQGTSFRPQNPALKGYRFGVEGYGIDHVSSFSGTLSNAGTAELSCQAAATEGIVGLPYRYTAEVSITDVSNQQISARNAVTVHPAAFYVGLARPENLTGFAQKGQKLTFPFILASLEGNPLTDTKLTAGDFTVELIRENWKPVQERGAGGSIYSNYEKENITEYTATVKPAAKGTVQVTPKNAGSYILSMSGTDTAGRKLKTDYRFYVTGSGASFWDRDYEDAVRLTPDQSLYNPGDTARILMESPLPAGRYLITVEREGIFTEEIRELDGNTQVLEIPVAGNYVPVVYVAVSSYSVRTKEPEHKLGELDLDKPKGIFGMTPVFVNTRVKAFSVELAADKSVYKPGEQATITLTARRGGKPLANAELTLLAVDRGVLDLIDYHVPNPLEFFYNPENFRLGVMGGDSRSWLMDPVMMEAKALAGGDSDGGKEGDEAERSNFNPTAVFIPILKTDANGRVTATFTLPDTLTSYRLTAVGAHTDLFALHEEEITVQNTVNILPVMPRRLRERDTAECGVLISNVDTRAHSITVSASVREPGSQDDSAADAQGGKQGSAGNAAGQKNGQGQDTSTVGIPHRGAAFIDGETTHTVTVAGGQQAAVYFDIAAVKAGTVEAVFSISSDALKEKLIQPLVIERPFVFETVTATGAIAQNESEAAEGLVIPSMADSNTGSLSLTLDSSGLGALSSAIEYVSDYPFLCMEQQSARILPLVLFDNYIDVFSLKSKVPNVRHTVTKTMAAWAREQHDDGGFPYWPGGWDTDFYVSLRIAHICAAAQQRGYTPDDIAVNTKRLTDYIRSQLLANRKALSPYLQAYACFVLAMNGAGFDDSILTAVRTRVLPQLEDYTAQPNDLAALALLSLTYAQRNRPGDAARAAQCTDRIINACRFTTRSVSLAVPPPKGYRFWYGNDLSLDLALILQSLVKAAPDHSREDAVRAVLYTLLQRQKGGYWQNTATTAHVLEAVYEYIQYAQLDATDLTAAASLSGGDLLTAAFKGAAAKPVFQMFSFKEQPVSGTKRDTLLPLRFTKTGTGQLYYTASLAYALPQECQQPRDEGLGVSCTIRDIAADKVITPDSENSSLITLESGKTYEMAIRLSSGKDYTFVALRAPIPSGAEILDAAFVTTASNDYEEEDTEESWTDWRDLSKQQIYDNEVQYFWNSWDKGGTTVRFKFRAARRGVFPCPPATAECMYENEIFGRSGGILYVIK